MIGEGAGCEICFAYPNFQWKNAAAHNAGVTVSIVGLAAKGANDEKILYEVGQKNGQDDLLKKKIVSNINAYLIGAEDIIVEAHSKPLSAKISALGGLITKGNQPTEGGNLLLTFSEKEKLLQETQGKVSKFIRPILGSAEFIRGEERFCIWVKPEEVEEAKEIPELAERFEKVREFRLLSSKETTRKKSFTPWFFDEVRQIDKGLTLLIPRVASEGRDYITAGVISNNVIVLDSAFSLFDAPLFCFALISSRLHRLWIGLACGYMGTSIRYSNTLGWNTFPVPELTEEVMEALTLSAQKILKAREGHYPATIAEMYDPKRMAEDYPALLQAHEENDEIVERHFFGMRPKTDEESLARLMNLYAQEIKKLGSVTGKRPSQKGKRK
ncbi:hypothetical protein FAI40_02655 [Acetobacteraceae bacterium]|nr:hypothetical protein FAI40_02655 [Acetobacteraceae bacterium]